MLAYMGGATFGAIITFLVILYVIGKINEQRRKT